MAPINYTGNLTAAQQVSPTLLVRAGANAEFVADGALVQFTLSGTWAGTVVLEIAGPGQLSWTTLNTFQYTGNVDTTWHNNTGAVQYVRFRCVAYTSGTIVYGLTYTLQYQVLALWLNSDGDTAFEILGDGVSIIIPGTSTFDDVVINDSLTVTGASHFVGAVTMDGALTVLGATSVQALAVAGTLTGTAINATSVTVNAGTNANTYLYVGSGGGAPSASRTVEVHINAPSSGGFLGQPQVVFARNGVTIWNEGLGAANGGAKTNTDDYFWYSSAYMMALTTAGQLVIANGMAVQAGNSGFQTITGTTLVLSSTLSAGDTTITNGNNLSVALSVGEGGASSAARTASITRNVSSSVTYVGEATDYYKRASATIWMTGIDAATAGVIKSATTDYVWWNGTTYVMALTQAGGLNLLGALSAGASSLIAAGVDASTTLTIGSGGSGPTANRMQILAINTPSNGTYLGDARIYVQRAGTSIWEQGIAVATGNAKAATTDYYWYNTAASSYRLALSAAGQLTAVAGFTSQSGTSALQATTVTTLVTSSTIQVGAGITSVKTSGEVLGNTSGTTGSLYLDFKNTSGWMSAGVNSSTGGDYTNGTAYAAYVGSINNKPLECVSNGALVASFDSNVTANTTSFQVNVGGTMRRMTTLAPASIAGFTQVFGW